MAETGSNIGRGHHATARVLLARFSERDRRRWLESALSILSAAERERVWAIPAADVGTAHAVGRALIRLVAARASGLAPQRITVVTTQAGKPLAANVPGLEVSVAHCGRAVAIAWCAAAVGVDIERVSAPAGRLRREAKRLFAARELEAMEAVGDVELPRWFEGLWTIKEAVGKALGSGVAPALAGVVVAGAGDRPRLGSVFAGPAADAWTLACRRAPGGEETLAVAVAAAAVRLAGVSRLSLAGFARACDAEPVAHSSQPVAHSYEHG